MPALLVDLSHHNDPAPTPAQLQAAGVAGVILKATEGTGYTDPVFAARRDLYGAAGLAVGAYHFTDLADPAAEADHFAAVFGGLRPGEFIGLDLEVTRAGVDPVGYSAAWLDRLATHFGGEVRLEYLNKAELAAHDWSPIAARGVELWLADYDGQQSVAGVPAGAFRTVTLKQYSDRGSVAGFTVDVDWLPGQLADLTGTPGGPLMALSDADQQTLFQRVGDLAAFVDWWLVPDTPGATGPNSKGELTKRVRDIAGQVAALTQQVTALQQAVAALPAQTAQALPAVACQGNPKAVLTAIGQAASTAATSAT